MQTVWLFVRKMEQTMQTKQLRHIRSSCDMSKTRMFSGAQNHYDVR